MMIDYFVLLKLVFSIIAGVCIGIIIGQEKRVSETIVIIWIISAIIWCWI